MYSLIFTTVHLGWGYWTRCLMQDVGFSAIFAIFVCFAVFLHLVKGKAGSGEIPKANGGILGVNHLIGLSINHQMYLQDLSRKSPGGIFSLGLLRSRLVVVTSPSLAKSVLTNFRLPLSTFDMMMYFLKNVFCEQGLLQRNGINEKQIHREVTAFMSQKFIDHAVVVMHSELAKGMQDYMEESTCYLNTHIKHEDESDLLFSTTKGHVVVETDLFNLVRGVVGKIAVRTLMGRSFVRKNPDFLQNLWDLDSGISQLLLGIDKLHLPVCQSARESRDRVLAAVNEHHEALFSTMESPDISDGYGDLSDVSEIFRQRLKDWTSRGVTTASCASANAALLWAANVNSAPVAFWLIWYLFQHKDMLEDVRSEITEHIQEEQTESGLRLRFDVQALVNQCHLLKAAFLETLRLEAHTFSFKLVTENCTLAEAPELAHTKTESQSQGYLLRKGDFVCVHHGAHQANSRYFYNAQEFNPSRFLRQNLHAKKHNETVESEHGNMYVFSGGKGECKGRNFARVEILVVAACMIYCWDIDPLESDSGWTQQGRIPTSGAHLPQRDIRVKMRRRTKNFE